LARGNGVLYRIFVEPLAFSKHPPQYDARAVFLGIFVGIAVPVGGHMATLGLLRAAFRFNFVVAVAFTLVNNPLDIIPLYYWCYRLGAWVLGDRSGLDYGAFRTLMNPVMDSSYFWEALHSFGSLGKQIVLNWFVGSFILSVPLSILGYVITLRVQKSRRRRAAEGMASEYKEYVAQLEKPVEPDG